MLIAESGVVNMDKSTLSAAFVAKRNLQEALESNNFSSKAKPVQDAVDGLTRFNSTKGDPISSNLYFGNWQALTNPTYPGPIKGTPDYVYKFTLGWMCCNMFQPKDLVCTLGKTMNPVESSSSDCSDDDSSERQSFSYSTETAITVAAPSVTITLARNATWHSKILVKSYDKAMRTRARLAEEARHPPPVQDRRRFNPANEDFFDDFIARSDTQTCTVDAHARPFNQQVRGVCLGGKYDLDEMSLSFFLKLLQ